MEDEDFKKRWYAGIEQFPIMEALEIHAAYMEMMQYCAQQIRNTLGIPQHLHGKDSTHIQRKQQLTDSARQSGRALDLLLVR